MFGWCCHCFPFLFLLLLLLSLVSVVCHLDCFLVLVVVSIGQRQAVLEAEPEEATSQEGDRCQQRHGQHTEHQEDGLKGAADGEGVEEDGTLPQDAIETKGLGEVDDTVDDNAQDGRDGRVGGQLGLFKLKQVGRSSFVDIFVAKDVHQESMCHLAVQSEHDGVAQHIDHNQSQQQQCLQVTQPMSLKPLVGSFSQLHLQQRTTRGEIVVGETSCRHRRC